MPSIFDVNFNLFSYRMMRPDRRLPAMLAFVRVLMKPLQYLRDQKLGIYREGAGNMATWAPGTYAKYQTVIYKQKVYESLQAGNTAEPTDQSKWRVVVHNFVGAEERAQYTSSKIVLEFAINKYFGTTFRQPLTGTSDIYFDTLDNPLNVFLIGNSPLSQSYIYTDHSTQFIINDYSFATYYNMQINFPQAVFDALDPSPENAEKIIRNFVNRILVAGITYKIVTY